MKSQHPPSREELAEIEIGSTEISRAQKWVLSFFFLTLIFSIPILQQMHGGAGTPPFAGIIAEAGSVLVGSSPGPSGGINANSFGRLVDANRILLRGMRDTENALTDSSFLAQSLLPPTQLFLTSVLGAGNERAYPGADRWLFYRPAIDSLTGAGFLKPKVLAARSRGGNEWAPPPQPDPTLAIDQFHRQLAERGIELILVPTPVKVSLHPNEMTTRYPGTGPAIRNSSYDRWVDSLDEGVLVFDPAPILVQNRDSTGAPQYLDTDTHWTPQAMQAVAVGLARFIRERIDLSPSADSRLSRHAGKVANLGDVAAMLTLPSSQDAYPDQSVDIVEVRDNEKLWSSDASADVLVLGDSFSNIYSLEAMGWGASAGFVEQLSFELARPIDAILRNDAGAHATREILSRELGRGRDRLEGKRVVVWQFSERELAVGDWRTYSTPRVQGDENDTGFLELDGGETMEVSGIVREISRAPRPGTVPYSDHIVFMLVTNLRLLTTDAEVPGNALIAMQSMKDSTWTSAAKYRVGDAVDVRIFNYDEIDTRDGIGALNSASLGGDLSLEEPVWGEPIEAVIETPARESPGKRFMLAIVVTGVMGALLLADRKERKGVIA